MGNFGTKGNQITGEKFEGQYFIVNFLNFPKFIIVSKIYIERYIINISEKRSAAASKLKLMFERISHSFI